MVFEYYRYIMSRGFTLTELMVVVGVIVVIAAAAAPAFVNRSRTLAVERSAHVLARELRGAEEQAISSRSIEAGGDQFVPTGGFGLHIQEADNTILLFADCDGSGNYTTGGAVCNGAVPERMTNKSDALEGSVAIQELRTGGGAVSDLSVVFRPPIPTVYTNGSVLRGAESDIVLESKGGEATSTVTVTGSGLIYAH